MPQSQITIPLADLDHWEAFASDNAQALTEAYGTIDDALHHARDGGLTLGGGAAPLVFVYFAENE